MMSYGYHAFLNYNIIALLFYGYFYQLAEYKCRNQDQYLLTIHMLITTVDQVILLLTLRMLHIVIIKGNS